MIPPPELTLEQMLSDVIVQLLMRRDRVTEAEIRELMASASRRRQAVALSPVPLSRAA
jgi:hypothetical protein